MTKIMTQLTSVSTMLINFITPNDSNYDVPFKQDDSLSNKTDIAD